MNVDGKVVAVTGGGSGIGRGLCERFVADGASVAVIDRDGAAAATVADGIGAQWWFGDMAVEEQVIAVIDEVEKQLGPIDLFCSNAGVGGDGDLDAPDAVWQLNWEVNLMAHVYAARALIPRMIERGGGYLLQTISAAGVLTSPGAGPYAVAKHAAVGLAEYIAITYGDRGITVSCLCPQAVQTKMLMTDTSPEIMKTMLATGALLQPDDVAQIVVEGLDREDFFIFSHPETHRQYQQRAADPDRWLRGMRRFIARTR